MVPNGSAVTSRHPKSKDIKSHIDIINNEMETRMRHIYKTKGTHASQKRNKITAARVGRGPAGRVRTGMMAGITLRVVNLDP